MSAVGQLLGSMEAMEGDPQLTQRETQSPNGITSLAAKLVQPYQQNIEKGKPVPFPVGTVIMKKLGQVEQQLQQAKIQDEMEQERQRGIAALAAQDGASPLDAAALERGWEHAAKNPEALAEKFEQNSHPLVRGLAPVIRKLGPQAVQWLRQNQDTLSQLASQAQEQQPAEEPQGFAEGGMPQSDGNMGAREAIAGIEALMPAAYQYSPEIMQRIEGQQNDARMAQMLSMMGGMGAGLSNLSRSEGLQQGIGAMTNMYNQGERDVSAAENRGLEALMANERAPYDRSMKAYDEFMGLQKAKAAAGNAQALERLKAFGEFTKEQYKQGEETARYTAGLTSAEGINQARITSDEGIHALDRESREKIAQMEKVAKGLEAAGKLDPRAAQLVELAKNEPDAEKSAEYVNKAMVLMGFDTRLDKSGRLMPSKKPEGMASGAGMGQPIIVH